MSKIQVTKQLSIEDIPAQKIKELLLQNQTENPTEAAIGIAKAAFTFMSLFDDHDVIASRDIVEAFYILERYFDMNVALMDTTKKVA